jgi:glyoxylase I family protein
MEAGPGAIQDRYVIELFSFPNPPARVSRPEALGLRHLAFEVANIDEAVRHLNANKVTTEPIRVDEFTGKRFTFFEDPDHLPLELYES